MTVLVLFALRGPSTAYDVKLQLEHFAKEFWAVPHTQVYRECERLEAAGLLESRQHEEGRRRRVYTVTDHGLDAVRRWVREPATASMQIRDVNQVKLMAAEFSTPEDVRRMAEAQVAAYRERLDGLDRLVERFAGRPGLATRMRSVEMGRAVYLAAIEFWAGVAAGR